MGIHLYHSFIETMNLIVGKAHAKVNPKNLNILKILIKKIAQSP
jgi:hypothetical protein